MTTWKKVNASELSGVCQRRTNSGRIKLYKELPWQMKCCKDELVFVSKRERMIVCVIMFVCMCYGEFRIKLWVLMSLTRLHHPKQLDVEIRKPFDLKQQFAEKNVWIRECEEIENEKCIYLLVFILRRKENDSKRKWNFTEFFITV